MLLASGTASTIAGILAADPAGTSAGVGASPHYGLSFIGGLTALAGVWFLKQRKIPKVEWLSPILILIGGIGLANSFVGDFIREVVGWLGMLPEVGSAVPGIVAVLCIGFVAYDLWPGHPTTKYTAPAAFCLPSVVTLAGGMIGGIAVEMLNAVGTAGDTALSKLFGIG